MKKHLLSLFGILAIGGLFYLMASGLFSLIFGYFILALGVAAPLVLAYLIDRDLFFPNWTILLWMGFMVASLGVIAKPELLYPVGYLACPEGMNAVDVSVQTEQLYDGATNTSATLLCRGAQGQMEPDTWIVLGVGAALYFLISLPLLLLAAAARPLQNKGWSKPGCFALALVVYILLAAVVWQIPGVPAMLRSLTQKILS